MKACEYIRLEIDLGDLGDLNALSGIGWHVVASFSEDGPATVLITEPHKAHYVLLERELLDSEARSV